MNRLSRQILKGAPLIAYPKHVQQRYASFYNTHIANLTEDQTEVRGRKPAFDRLHLLTHLSQFRNAVTAFSEAEIAPRAEQTDKSNNFPMVLATTGCFILSLALRC